MSTAYGKVRGGKLTFKGGLEVDKIIGKKTKKKKAVKPKAEAAEADDGEAINPKTGEEEPLDEDKKEGGKKEAEYVPDGGTGFQPDGKTRSKKYEELFPVETRRFGYEVPGGAASSREDALLERVKKKADKFCK